MRRARRPDREHGRRRVVVHPQRPGPQLLACLLGASPVAFGEAGSLDVGRHSLHGEEALCDFGPAHLERAVQRRHVSLRRRDRHAEDEGGLPHRRPGPEHDELARPEAAVQLAVEVDRPGAHRERGGPVLAGAQLIEQFVDHLDGERRAGVLSSSARRR